MGVQALDADLVCLQEVRLPPREAAQFDHTGSAGREGPGRVSGARGYEVAYRTNAKTRTASTATRCCRAGRWATIGHHDVSDHAFEQRGLLHVPVHWQGTWCMVVAHFGLIHSSRVRQVRRLAAFMRDVPAGAGAGGGRLQRLGRAPGRAHARPGPAARSAARRPPACAHLPVAAAGVRAGPGLHRGLRCTGVQVPRGPSWARMSDHLPLLVELTLA
jgi:endonuclease/exonuclease/phosphatase family metal-dependent hydrolase